jgi:hypothetical protein
MPHSDYIVYVDESGDHGLESIDPNYPVFSLVCCVFEKIRYSGEVAPALQNFKFRWWGHDLVVLHEQEIRKQKPPYAFLQNRERRERFIEDLAAVIEAAPFTLIASVIDKERHKEQYIDPANPYDIALTFCVERTYAFLRDQGQQDRLTHFIVEKRGRREDNDLELAFRRICDGGNQWGVINTLQLEFAEKIKNLTGLQIADLTARPIGLSVLRPNQPNRAFQLIKPKFRRSSGGKVRGWGLKVFP